MQSSLLQRAELHMGTGVLISVPRDADFNEAETNRAIDECFARAKEIDEKFSVYKKDSVISCIGRGELAQDQFDSETRFIFDLCEKLTAITGGAFDIYAAGQRKPAADIQRSGRPNARPIDPSGVVKGWAIQECAEVMQSAGLQSFCVNIGGDIYASGFEAPGLPWQVGLQHPIEREKIMAVLHLHDMAIATSGLYERGDHIVGVQPESTHELYSLSVIGADIILADAYATSAFAMGARGVDWVADQNGFDVFAVTSTLQVLTSPGLDEFREHPAS